MKALIYARQSSGKEDVSESVEAQIGNCRKLAEQEHLEIIGIFRDLNSSGETYPEGAERLAEMDRVYQQWAAEQSCRKIFRTGLSALLRKLPEADLLLVNELTRLYRPVTGSFLESYLNSLLRENHITVFQFQGGQIDLSRFDQQLITMLKNQILYEDLQKKRWNSIHACQIKRDSGKLCCGTRIFGLQYLGKDKIKVDPDAAEIIRFLYSGILRREPYSYIIKECTARRKDRKIFYPSLFYSIASQPVYAGYQYNTKGQLIPNQQMQRQEIISLEDWLQVQEILQEKRRLKVRSGKLHWLPLSGRLFCGNCGAKLVCRIDHHKVYYVCGKADYDRTQIKCRNSRIRFETGAWGEPGLYDAILPLLGIGLLAEEKENIQPVEQRDFSGFLQKKEDLLELFLEGNLTKKQFQSGMERWKAKQKALAMENCHPDVDPAFFDLLRKNLASGQLTKEIFERLLRETELTAVVFREKVLFHTCSGEVELPRLWNGPRVRMPDWKIRLQHRRDGTAVYVTYRTGHTGKLADFGRFRVWTK